MGEPATVVHGVVVHGVDVDGVVRERKRKQGAVHGAVIARRKRNREK